MNINDNFKKLMVRPKSSFNKISWKFNNKPNTRVISNYNFTKTQKFKNNRILSSYSKVRNDEFKNNMKFINRNDEYRYRKDLNHEIEVYKNKFITDIENEENIKKNEAKKKKINFVFKKDFNNFFVKTKKTENYEYKESILNNLVYDKDIIELKRKKFKTNFCLKNIKVANNFNFYKSQKKLKISKYDIKIKRFNAVKVKLDNYKKMLNLFKIYKKEINYVISQAKEDYNNKLMNKIYWNNNMIIYIKIFNFFRNLKFFFLRKKLEIRKERKIYKKKMEIKGVIKTFICNSRDNKYNKIDEYFYNCKKAVHIVHNKNKFKKFIGTIFSDILNIINLKFRFTKLGISIQIKLYKIINFKSNFNILKSKIKNNYLKILKNIKHHRLPNSFDLYFSSFSNLISNYLANYLYYKTILNLYNKNYKIILKTVYDKNEENEIIYFLNNQIKVLKIEQTNNQYMYNDQFFISFLKTIIKKNYKINL